MAWASSGKRPTHSSAWSRLGAHLTPTVPALPRKAKILGPTLATVSPSPQGWSGQAPGLARQYSVRAAGESRVRFGIPSSSHRPTGLGQPGLIAGAITFTGEEH